jgi:transcriptional regulator with XRE-family HTH domain
LKTLKQRFIELYVASGWSQAELARRMDKTRGGINGIITGETSPDPSSVKFLETLLLQAGKAIPARDHEQEIESRQSEVDELRGKLSEIQQKSPENFRAAKQLIDALHSQISSVSPKVPRKPAAASRHLKKSAQEISSSKVHSAVGEVMNLSLPPDGKSPGQLPKK